MKPKPNKLIEDYPKTDWEEPWKIISKADFFGAMFVAVIIGMLLGLFVGSI